MSESSPRVIIGVEAGQWFSDIDIKEEALSEYVESLGINPASTEIHINTEDTLFETLSGELRAIEGIYYSRSGVVTLYPYRIKRDYDLKHEAMKRMDNPEAIREKFNQYWSERYSYFLNHELAHKKRRVAQGREGNESHPDFTAFELARAALSQKDYLFNQEEAECHAEAAVGPTDIIRFQIRELPNERVAADFPV